MSQSQNARAKVLKALHKPGKPLVLANVYDGATAEAVATLPNCRALATASKAIAIASGTEDDDLDLAGNMTGVRTIARVVAKHGLPLTADLQDGYGEQLEDAISQVVDAGVVGVNIEDFDRVSGKMFSVEVAAQRVELALRVANSKGVPDFVVNARCDLLLYENDLAGVIERGLSYLKAGATTVFVWGGAKRGGTTKDEVVQLSEAFQGRLNVSMKIPEGSGLTVDELSKIGVSRISIGPKLQALVLEAYGQEAAKLLRS